MPTNLNILFQNANSTTMENMIMFNDHMTAVIIFNLMMILKFSKDAIKKMILNKNMLESNKTETFWTLTPMSILITMSIPSMTMLYLMEEPFKPIMNIKITSNQWYWSYQIPELKNNMMTSNLKEKSMFRILETNNPLIIPTMMPIKMMITSNDVIHSWSIPSAALKMDSIPGRLNSIMSMFKKSGILTGQCSEICGMNHSFMPIWLNIMNKKMM